MVELCLQCDQMSSFVSMTGLNVVWFGGLMLL